MPVPAGCMCEEDGCEHAPSKCPGVVRPDIVTGESDMFMDPACYCLRCRAALLDELGAGAETETAALLRGAVAELRAAAEADAEAATAAATAAAEAEAIRPTKRARCT